MKIKNISFLALRNRLCWKQKFFGMLFGMGKQAVSRVETGERKTTHIHNEMLSLVVFLDENNLLGDYVRWRFGFKVSRRFYKNGTPMEYQKYLKRGQNE